MAAKQTLRSLAFRRGAHWPCIRTPAPVALWERGCRLSTVPDRWGLSTAALPGMWGGWAPRLWEAPTDAAWSHVEPAGLLPLSPPGFTWPPRAGALTFPRRPESERGLGVGQAGR